MRAVLETFDKRNYLICRKVAATLRDTVFADVENAIGRLGLKDFFKVEVSRMVITNLSTGFMIYFKGLDRVAKINGISPKNGVPITDIWIDEATEITEVDYDTLLFRQRGMSEMKIRKHLSFNPVSKHHWIYKRFFDPYWNEAKGRIQYNKKDDVLITKTNHWDNPFLTMQNHVTYEKTKFTSPYFYQVYCLGNWGVIGHRAFDTLTKVEISNDFINRQDDILYGLDWGWFPDPFAYTESVLDKQGNIYTFREIRGLKCDPVDVYRKIKNYCHGTMYCDTSSPVSTSKLQRLGLPAVNVYKPQGGRSDFVQFANAGRWYIDAERCPHLWSEANSYVHAQDRNGDVIEGEFAKANDHSIDSVMYGIRERMKAHIPPEMRKMYPSLGYRKI